MHGMKLASLNASFDRTTLDAALEKLSPRDEAVLPLSQPRDHPVRSIPRPTSHLSPPPVGDERCVFRPWAGQCIVRQILDGMVPGPNARVARTESRLPNEPVKGG
jgi:hypothetical protein